MIPLFANRAAKAGGRGIAKKNVPKLIYFAILIPNVVVKQAVSSVVTDPGIGIQRSDSLALFCGRKKIRIFKARIRIFVAR
jgi:hypothetical protein